MVAFYLGAHRPRWLEISPVPLFISYHTLSGYRRGGDHFPKGHCEWALDSGGFNHIARHGEWTISPDTYGGAVYRFIEDVGTPPTFAAPQDMMCEPGIRAKTGLTTAIHQDMTTENVLYLRQEFPHARWIPVIQGWELEDYLAHVALYEAAGIDLTAEYRVGLGSVCRRQNSDQIGAIVTALHALGIKLHGFGIKRQGLKRYGHLLTSADSMAWSYGARRRHIKLDGCDHEGPCNNCLRYALQWRQGTVALIRSLTEGEPGRDDSQYTTGQPVAA